MRLSILLTAFFVLAVSSEGQSQTAPTSPALPTVEKPKSKPVAPVPDADPAVDADPNVKPDPDAKKDDTPADADAERSGRGNRKGARPATVDRDASQTEGSGSAGGHGPDYTGPAILSRGVNFVRPSLPANERFRPFVGISFVHDTGISGQYQGVTNGTGLSGNSADLSYGISGQHVRRTDTIQVDYQGHSLFGDYASQNQALALGYSRVLSRRLTATITEAAGLYSNSFSILNGLGQTDTSVANTTLLASPTTEPYSDRTYFSTTTADVAYQRSSRLSFNVGGSTFNVHRNSSNLISLSGFQARMDVAYRFTKRVTVGPYYAYSQYDYSGTFGDTQIHTVGVNYSYALDKRTQLGFRFGETHLETRGLTVVTLDPAIAAILGTQQGIERYHETSYLPDIAVNISRSFRRSSISAVYSRGVSPGNGVVLTSQHDSETLSYTYSGLRKYALSFSGGRDTLSSQIRNQGGYNSYYARLSMSHALVKNLQSILALEYRRIANGALQTIVQTTPYDNNQYRISIGLTYSPGLGPLRFW